LSLCWCFSCLFKVKQIQHGIDIELVERGNVLIEIGKGVGRVLKIIDFVVGLFKGKMEFISEGRVECNEKRYWGRNEEYKRSV